MEEISWRVLDAGAWFGQKQETLDGFDRELGRPGGDERSSSFRNVYLKRNGLKLAL